MRVLITGASGFVGRALTGDSLLLTGRTERCIIGIGRKGCERIGPLGSQGGAYPTTAPTTVQERPLYVHTLLGRVGAALRG